MSSTFVCVFSVLHLPRGAYGRVLHCKSPAGAELAAKIIKKKGGNRGLAQLKDVRQEVMIMNRLQHSNVLKFHAAYDNTDDLILVFEL